MTPSMQNHIKTLRTYTVLCKMFGQTVEVIAANESEAKIMACRKLYGIGNRLPNLSYISQAFSAKQIS